MLRGMCTVFLTIAVLLTIAAPAVAAPTPGATYGGGQLPPGKGTVQMSAEVAPDGRTVRVVASLAVDCTRTISSYQLFAASGQIGEDGRLRMNGRARPFFYATKPSGGRAQVSMDLGFDGATASGTVEAKVRERIGSRKVTCAATIQSQLRMAAVDTSAAAPVPAGALLLGTGSADYRSAAVPVAFQVSSTGRTLSRTAFGIPLTCRSTGGGDYLQNYAPGVRIAADGTFADDSDFIQRFRGGVRVRTTVRLRGRFTAQGVTGTYSARSTTTAPRRNGLRCSSGRIAFAAIR